jgi:hypothetical protein
MIGLGSSLTSGVPESKYSASFDGDGDFIELGNSDDIISTSQANVTLMCWVKPEEEAGNQYIFTNRRTAGSSNFSLRMHSDGGIKFNGLIYTGTGLSTTLMSTTTITAGTWYHVAITAKNGEQKIYINGQPEHTLALNVGMSPSTTESCTIASSGGIGDGNFYEGLVSELAIFNACLTGEAVLAAYNSGFDLKTNVGDYTNSSDITHYYKMGDGLFDDKANGIVHDQDNPGLGDNLLTGNDSTFSGTNNWTEWSPSGTTGLSTGSGILTVTLSGEAGSIDSGVQIANTHLGISSAGFTYLVEADVWLGTATGTDWRFYLGGPTLGFDPTTTRTRFKWYVRTINTGNLKIYKNSTGGDTGTFFIDDVVVKKLNGNPGETSGGVTFSSNTP